MFVIVNSIVTCAIDFRYFRRGHTMAATLQDAPGGVENTRCNTD